MPNDRDNRRGEKLIDGWGLSKSESRMPPMIERKGLSMRFKTVVKVGIATGLVLAAAATGGIIYVIAHFLAKVW